MNDTLIGFLILASFVTIMAIIQVRGAITTKRALKVKIEYLLSIGFESKIGFDGCNYLVRGDQYVYTTSLTNYSFPEVKRKFY